MGDLMTLVVKAWLGRVWLPLGYESWDSYVKGEFEYAPLHLPRDERRAVVALLRGQGMSTRAIGSATGSDHATVVRDLAAGANAPPDDPAPVTGLDGKTYRNPEPKELPPLDAEVVEEPQQETPKTTVCCPTCGGTGEVTK